MWVRRFQASNFVHQISLNDRALYVLKLEYVEPFFIMRNNTRAFRYSKIEYVNKLKLEYVNGHFSEENNTRGSTYSTSWVRKRKQNHDDGTVRHRLNHLNGIYEQYIDCSINHRPRMYCCINYVLVYLLSFWLLWRVQYDVEIKYRYVNGDQNLK